MTPSELSGIAAAAKGDESKRSLQGKLHTSPPRPKIFQPGDLHPDIIEVIISFVRLLYIMLYIHSVSCVTFGFSGMALK